MNTQVCRPVTYGGALAVTDDGVMAYAAHDSLVAIAHRGGAGHGPENTMAAFARSVALGVRHLETDVRLTADGELACFHDATLSRVTRASGPVRERTMAQLRRLRVASGTGVDSGFESGFGADGADRIVSLAEVLEALPDARISVDLKEVEAIEPLARLLARRDVGERVCVAGAWDGWLERVRELVPHTHTALGWRSLTALIGCARLGLPVPEWAWAGAPLGGRVSAGSGVRVGAGTRVDGAGFAHVPVALRPRTPTYCEFRAPCTAHGTRNKWGWLDRLVAQAHARGIRVMVWTVDEPSMMDRLIDAGVDGIITDRPDLLRERMIRRDLWRPPTPTPPPTPQPPHHHTPASTQLIAPERHKVADFGPDSVALGQ